MLEHLLQVIREAGRKVMDIYDDMDPTSVKIKEDGSPVTQADLVSHLHIVNNLPGDYPILSEEKDTEIPFEERQHWKRFWCIDPLDGTKDFIQQNDEFVINIALIEGNKPILGLVHVPCTDTTYFAKSGHGAYILTADGKCSKIGVKEIEGTVKVVTSRNHCNDKTLNLIGRIAGLYSDKVIESVHVGSALKFILIAEGNAHYYPRMVPTMEWDTAAPQIIVEEAGGQVVSMDTWLPLTYNKECLRNPFIWSGIDTIPLDL